MTNRRRMFQWRADERHVFCLLGSADLHMVLVMLGSEWAARAV
jgi:hypothetical protein